MRAGRLTRAARLRSRSGRHPIKPVQEWMEEHCVEERARDREILLEQIEMDEAAAAMR